MAAPVGNVAQLQFGAGRILIAPVGATEPTDLVTGWDAAWLEMGLTKDGVHHKFAQTVQEAYVEELFDPVFAQVSQRKASVAFNAAQLTALNLKRALNGGTITTASGVTKFEPAQSGAQTFLAVGWESDTSDERWVWRRCLNTAASDIARRTKNAEYATVGVEFGSYAATGGAAAFMSLMTAATRAA